MTFSELQTLESLHQHVLLWKQIHDNEKIQSQELQNENKNILINIKHPYVDWEHGPRDLFLTPNYHSRRNLQQQHRIRPSAVHCPMRSFHAPHYIYCIFQGALQYTTTLDYTHRVRVSGRIEPMDELIFYSHRMVYTNQTICWDPICTVETEKSEATIPRRSWGDAKRQTPRVTAWLLWPVALNDLVQVLSILEGPWCRFLYSVRLSKVKDRFSNDEGGCCHFCIYIYMYSLSQLFRIQKSRHRCIVFWAGFISRFVFYKLELFQITFSEKFNFRQSN